MVLKGPKFKFNFEQVSSLWLPIFLVVVYFIAFYFLKDILPTTSEVLNGFGQLFAKYGYELIFFGAFLEGALLIDWLVPGSSVVLAGSMFSRLGYLSYPILYLVASVGFFLGYFLDYLIGYYGWSDIVRKIGFSDQLDNARQKLIKHRGKAFLIGYFHPDTASLFALAAGMTKMGLREYLSHSLVATLFWVFVWTGLVFLFGYQIESLLENNTLIILLFVPILFIFLKIIKFF